jgi:hypothetical protein
MAAVSTVTAMVRIAGLLRVFLRAVETTLRQCSPGTPPGARFGAVAFVHRFGSDLNSQVHYHVLVTDGGFSGDAEGGAEFHPATDLTTADFAAVQANIRRRGLRWLHHHGLERRQFAAHHDIPLSTLPSWLAKDGKLVLTTG